MVLLFLGDSAKFVDELQRLLEILKLKFAFNLLVVYDRPIIDLVQQGRNVSVR